MSGIQSMALGWVSQPSQLRVADARQGACPHRDQRRSVLVTVPKVRNVGAYRVTGEKPDDQAETGCTDSERDLLVRHDKPEVFYWLGDTIREIIAPEGQCCG